MKSSVPIGTELFDVRRNQCRTEHPPSGRCSVKDNIIIISWRTEERDGLLSDRIKHLYGAFFLDITGFFAFSVVGCPIP